jgi:hypothetical protein
VISPLIESTPSSPTEDNPDQDRHEPPEKLAPSAELVLEMGDRVAPVLDPDREPD